MQGNLNFTNNNMAGGFGGFNLGDYKNNEYLKTLYNPAKLYAAAEARMEQRAVEQAEEVISGDSFGAITLAGILAEKGWGPRAFEQMGNSAKGIVTGLFEPITDYLEKYENIFNQSVYNAEFQSYAKQLFFSNQAMALGAAQKPDGQQFVYTM